MLSRMSQINRRQFTVGALLATGLLACKETAEGTEDAGNTEDTGDTGEPGDTESSTDTALDSCEVADDTTAGPYPDTVGMVDDEAFYRSDITDGLYPDAVSLELTLQIVDGTSCEALSGYTVEIWHCDPSGHYSEYSGQPGGYDGTGETYLRGLQITDESGQVTFTTIYPGWYVPRTTHIHVRIYQDGSLLKTTQIGFDDALNAEVNASAGYGGSNSFTNDTDQVFVDEGDGAEDNLCTATGSAEAGVVASFVVGL